jgi:hypothetical protein
MEPCAQQCLKTFLEKETNGSFYADLYIEKGSPMFFRVNPLDEEEVTLEKRTENYLHHNREIQRCVKLIMKIGENLLVCFKNR